MAKKSQPSFSLKESHGWYMNSNMKCENLCAFVQPQADGRGRGCPNVPATGPHEQRHLHVQRRRNFGRQRGALVQLTAISVTQLETNGKYSLQINL